MFDEDGAEREAKFNTSYTTEKFLSGNAVEDGFIRCKVGVRGRKGEKMKNILSIKVIHLP